MVVRDTPEMRNASISLIVASSDKKKNMIGFNAFITSRKKKVYLLQHLLITSNTKYCVRLTCILPDIPRKTSPWGPRQLPSWDIDRLSGDAISPTNGDWRQQDTQLHDWQECGQDPSLTSWSELDRITNNLVFCEIWWSSASKRCPPPKMEGCKSKIFEFYWFDFGFTRQFFLKNHRIMLKPKTLKET